MMRILNLRRKSTLRRLRQKAYDSALKGASQKPTPAVRVFPTPIATVALSIALVAAVLFSFMRLMAPADDDVVLEGANATTQGEPASSGEVVESTQTSGHDGYVMVQVTGAVKRPSVVKVPVGSRGMDAVNAAGGLTQDASLASVNLAVQVVDGQHIHVLTTEEAGVAGSSSGASSDSAGAQVGGVAGTCIDLRSADLDTLQMLPGVGPALAARIDSYRSESGLKNPEDVRNVSGIGAKTYDGFKDMLCP